MRYSKFVHKTRLSRNFVFIFFSTSCTKIQFWNDWRPNQIIPFVFWFVWNLFYKNVYARSYVRFATLIFQTNVIWFGKTFIRCNLLLFFLPYYFFLLSSLVTCSMTFLFAQSLASLWQVFSYFRPFVIFRRQWRFQTAIPYPTVMKCSLLTLLTSFLYLFSK